MPKDAQKVPLSNAAYIEAGRRNAAWLRQAWPEDTAKRTAQRFNASHHTVRRWLAGHMPENRHFQAMAHEFGKRYVAFVMEPFVGPWATYSLDEELDDLRARIDALDAELKEERNAAVLSAYAAVPSMEGANPHHQGRALEKKAARL